MRKSPSLEGKSPKELLELVRVTGEGKGRLSLGKNKAVFSVDSALINEDEWILSVSVPFHGEQVISFSDLKKKKPESAEFDSFRQRIKKQVMVQGLNKQITTELLFKEIRGLIRFVLAPKLKLERVCTAKKEKILCLMDDEEFQLVLDPKKNELFISRILEDGNKMVVKARSLTESIFSNTSFFFYLKKEKKIPAEPIFSLELFW